MSYSINVLNSLRLCSNLCKAGMASSLILSAIEVIKAFIRLIGAV